MKVIAVILTYNRLSLLKKCIDSVRKQTYPPDLIIVVNNASTDHTAEWLKNESIITHSLANNSGASGGFSECLKISYQYGADWVWLMDDDTIAKDDTLEKLIGQLHELKPYEKDLGFLCSNVQWTDGNPHAMNLTYTLEDKNKLAKLPLSLKTNVPVIQFSTFVSILISSKAIEKVGLPLKEYFIWNDDIEYTRRIIANGLAGIAVKDSIAVHETPVNHFASVFTDLNLPTWKYSYGLRNELYTKRILEGELVFWLTWIHRMFLLPVRILLKRKNYHWPYIKLVWNTSINALFFKPKIEKLAPNSWGSKAA